MTDVTPPTPPTDGTPLPAAPTTPPAATGPATAYTAPPAAPKPVNPGLATTLIWRRRDRATLAGALTAVVVGYALQFVSGFLYLFVSLAYAIVSDLGYFADDLGTFAFESIWRALFFFGPAFFALWLLLPLVKESTLPMVMKRAAVASVAGVAGLVFFGIFDIIASAIGGYATIGSVAVDLLWWPIYIGFGNAIVLVLGAVVAWLRAFRPAKVATVAPAAPAAAPTAPAAAPPTPAAPAAAPPAAPAAEASPTVPPGTPPAAPAP